MKYILFKQVTTGRGFTYTHYLQSISESGAPYVIMSVMRREEAKIYTSRRAALEDLKKAGDKWNIEKL